MCAVVSLILLFTVTWAGASSSNPFAGMKTYDEGTYRVGVDFTAGEYVLLATTSYSGYFSINSDANGDNIIANDLFDVNSIITVYAGEYLELARCVAVYAPDFYSQYSVKSENSGVMLRVGYDILPGQYKLIADAGTNGYYAIYNDSRHTKIVDNDLFKNSSWVSVTSGQYIVLSRCHIQ